MRASRPLPGIRLRRPGNIHPVQLVETLSSPPGTLAVREEIPLPAHRRRTAVHHMFAWNAQRLIDVNHVGIRDVVVRSEILPRGIKPCRYTAERVAALNHVDLVAIGTWGLRECAK